MPSFSTTVISCALALLWWRGDAKPLVRVVCPFGNFRSGGGVTLLCFSLWWRLICCCMLLMLPVYVSSLLQYLHPVLVLANCHAFLLILNRVTMHRYIPIVKWTHLIPLLQQLPVLGKPCESIIECSRVLQLKDGNVWLLLHGNAIKVLKVLLTCL